MQIGEHVAMGNGIEIRRAADELRGVYPHNLTRSRRYVISGIRGGLKSATSLMDAKQIAEKEIKSIE